MESHITPAGKSVFEDLGLHADESENLKIRAKLMDSLVRYVREHNLSQMEAAEHFGVGQGRVSLLMNGRISKFTIDALVNMHSHAGIEVRVEVIHA